MKHILLFIATFLYSYSIFAATVQPDIQSLYANRSGFGIPNEERELIKTAGGNATYGEILPTSVRTLIKDLQLTEDDVFYDLGSGVGKVAVQVYLESPVRKIVGAELSATRHQHAVQVYDLLHKNGYLQKGRNLIFREENILNTNLEDATVIFLCSTCYSEELMQGLAEKIQDLKPGTRVLTLKQFKDTPKLKLIKNMALPVSWAEKNTVYFYEVIE